MAIDQEKASRFLMQATLGANYADIEALSKQGIDTWLKQQFAYKPSSSDLFEFKTSEIWNSFKQRLISTYGEAAINGDGNNPALPYSVYFRMAWWHKTLTAPAEGLLRHRIAQALSEVLVISDSSVLELDAEGMGNYYDLLYKHAFGSYKQLLTDVSLHPCMGVYLTHINNRKEDKAQRIHPDENYAREIMQLFSIGLFELNADGSRKKDKRGRDIPTYDNGDIQQLARVFTGIRGDSYQYEWNTSFWEKSTYDNYPIDFEDDIPRTYKTIPFINMRKPMLFDENYHDRGAKTFLKGRIALPGKQDAKTEIKEVVRQLVAHPNAGPFIARRLINQLVTSNPSPEYIQTVAHAFGKEGDLGATVKAILTYPLNNPVTKGQKKKVIQSQKMKSPVLRVTQLLRAFNATNKSDKLWMNGDDIKEYLSQHPVSAPTVFNFYKPDFMPHGPLEKADLLAPEFELHTSATSIGYVNMLYDWLFGDYYPLVSTQIAQDIANFPEHDPERIFANEKDRISLDFSYELTLAKDESKHEELIDHVSLLLTGKTNLSIKPRVEKAFSLYKDNPLWVVQTVVFMIAISPEFVVLEA